ncbi:MAG: hypothetical protein KGL16_12275 [Acidobacteriota bacterium]|nr:hypothetical protein [Acidobacteriota bacterium]
MGTGKSVHRILTKPATVRGVVRATDALQAARVVGACPMIMVLGPRLMVLFRGARAGGGAGSGGTGGGGRPTLAQAQVQVTYGSRGSSGSSACFPIRYASGAHSATLVGNNWVRLIGRLIGTAIS